MSETEPRPNSKDNNAQTLFDRRKDKALAIVVLAVHPSVLYLLNDPTCPVEVWKKLEDQFQPKTWSNKLHLWRKLYGLKLIPGTSVQEHCKQMIEIFNELAVLDDPVSEEDRVMHLLASLPESYDVLVTALEANKTVPNMETVIERLTHEERRQNERCQSGSEVGLFSRYKKPHRKGQGQGTQKGQGQGQGPMCYKCKGFGHIRKNCPQLRKGNKKHGGEKAQKAEDDTVFFAAETALTSSTVSCTKWIIDSGATSHMCCNDKLFESLQPLQHPVKVSIGDGHELHAKGIGSVNLRVNCDGKRSSCHLRDVLYVPHLEYNLISISKAGQAGKVSRFDGSKCEIMTKEGTVIASGVCEGSLYSLTVENECANITSDAWHRRYGHLNYQSLCMLKNKGMVTGLKVVCCSSSFSYLLKHKEYM